MVTSSFAGEASLSGVWIQHGTLSNVAGLDYVVGGELRFWWKKLETEDGVWDWSMFDDQLRDAAKQGLFLDLSLLVGPTAPDWIYDRSQSRQPSVPTVSMDTTGSHSGKMTFTTYPYYLDTTYQQLFLRAVRKFAAHIASLPTGTRSAIVAMTPDKTCILAGLSRWHARSETLG